MHGGRTDLERGLREQRKLPREKGAKLPWEEGTKQPVWGGGGQQL